MVVDRKEFFKTQTMFWVTIPPPPRFGLRMRLWTNLRSKISATLVFFYSEFYREYSRYFILQGNKHPFVRKFLGKQWKPRYTSNTTQPFQGQKTLNFRFVVFQDLQIMMDWIFCESIQWELIWRIQQIVVSQHYPVFAVRCQLRKDAEVET